MIIGVIGTLQKAHDHLHNPQVFSRLFNLCLEYFFPHHFHLLRGTSFGTPLPHWTDNLETPSAKDVAFLTYFVNCV
jgi:hypothetical protein